MYRVLLILMCLSLGCSSNDDPAVFVGVLGGGQILAASVWSGEDVVVYTCGRDGSLADSTVWLSSAPVDGTVEMGEGSFAVVATREGAQVLGAWNNGAGQQDLSLIEVAAEDGGLFERSEGLCRTAAVAIRGANGELAFQGAHFCDPEGPFFQVTPVRPLSALSDVVRVRVEDGSGLEVDLPRR